MSIWILTMAVLGFFFSYVFGNDHRRLRTLIAAAFLVLAIVALTLLIRP